METTVSSGWIDMTDPDSFVDQARQAAGVLASRVGLVELANAAKYLRVKNQKTETAMPVHGKTVEETMFEETLLRYNQAPWVFNLGAEIKWFRERAKPDAEGLNLLDQLTRWDDWLIRQHELFKRGRTNRFPKDFRASLRNWFKRAREYRGDSNATRDIFGWEGAAD